MSSSAGVCSGGQAACLGGTLHALRPQPCARPLGFCTLGVTKVLASAGLCLPPAGLSMSHCRLSILRVRGESEAGRVWQREILAALSRVLTQEFEPGCLRTRLQLLPERGHVWGLLLASPVVAVFLILDSSFKLWESTGNGAGREGCTRGLMLEMVHACGVEVEECRPVQDRSGVRTCGTRD